MADPIRNFKFSVSVAGFSAAMGFSKVMGLGSKVEVIEYREGADGLTSRKFTGQVSYDNVTLERGLTHDSDLIDWLNATYDPSSAANAALSGTQKRDVTIQVMQKNNVVAREFVLKNAFVASRKLTDLDASANDILIETLELAHDGIVEKKYSDTGAPR